MHARFELDDAFDRVQRKWIEESPGVYSVPLAELTDQFAEQRPVAEPVLDDDVVTILSQHINIDVNELRDEEWTKVSAAEFLWATGPESDQWDVGGAVSLANLVSICLAHQRTDRDRASDLWEFIVQVCYAGRLEVDDSDEVRNELKVIVESSSADVNDDLLKWARDHVHVSRNRGILTASHTAEDRRERATARRRRR